MNDVRFSTHGPDDWASEGANAVDNGLGDFNDAAAPLHEVQKLACIARDASGRVLGGATGRTWGELAELQMLWVDETRRRQGLGAELVKCFEAAVQARACTVVTLETYSFQAPAFYRALGYTTVFTNRHFPHGLAKFLMEKRLADPDLQTAALRLHLWQDAKTAATDPQLVPALADLLADAVDGGASVGFLAPLPPSQALAWAQHTVASLGPGLQLWMAERQGRFVGTVQLGPCLKPNGRHRAELMKLLVHRSARGQGVARQLLAAVDEHARQAGLRLLVLDTLVGSEAEAIYRHLGWQPYGLVPDFALATDGTPCATACFYRQLA